MVPSGSVHWSSKLVGHKYLALTCVGGDFGTTDGNKITFNHHFTDDCLVHSWNSLLLNLVHLS